MKVRVFAAPSRRACSEYALVLQATGIQATVVEEGGDYLLLVHEINAEAARRELAGYLEDEIKWRRPRPRPFPSVSNGVNGVIAYAAIVTAAFIIERMNVGGADWFTTGRLNAGLVEAGEWWRTVTALTLHLDIAHLSANLVFGIVFGLLAARWLGSGLAWFSILLAGAIGNGLNAWIQPDAHNAVGASTAIFGALGLLGAFAWRWRKNIPARWPYRLGPVIAAIALLAYTGIGGERTDVMAHVTGFVSGLAIGAILGGIVWRRYPGRAIQWAAGAGAAGLLVFAWIRALSGS